MNVEKLIEYWNKNEQEKWKTAQSLMKSKRYSDALFFCHLSIESALKAIVVSVTKTMPPFTHNLLQLARLSNVILPEKYEDLLKEVNTFNIRARYDDYKLSFYKKATKTYAQKYYEKISEFKIWIKNYSQNNK